MRLGGVDRPHGPQPPQGAQEVAPGHERRHREQGRQGRHLLDGRGAGRGPQGAAGHVVGGVDASEREELAAQLDAEEGPQPGRSTAAEGIRWEATGSSRKARESTRASSSTSASRAGRTVVTPRPSL